MGQKKIDRTLAWQRRHFLQDTLAHCRNLMEEHQEKKTNDQNIESEESKDGTEQEARLEEMPK